MNRKNVSKIIQILNKKYHPRPWKSKPFRVLIGVILSHRTRDETSLPATSRLFRRAKNLDGILKLSEKEIAKIIYPVGFYNQKAKRIKAICKILKEKYHGKVPKTREELMQLPGVGGKSADIVLSFAYGEPVIATDTHVAAVSRRLHWTENKDPEKIRGDLHMLIPKKYWLLVNNLLVDFGKEVCSSPRPKCYMCFIEKYCPYESKNLKPPKVV
jgi:endonuclease-3